MILEHLLEIECDECDGTFMIYEDQLDEDQEVINCPYCDAENSIVEDAED